MVPAEVKKRKKKKEKRKKDKYQVLFWREK